MAEVDKKPPGLPEEVPEELRMELGRLQRQIKVLLNNYQVRNLQTVKQNWRYLWNYHLRLFLMTHSFTVVGKQLSTLVQHQLEQVIDPVLKL